MKKLRSPQTRYGLLAAAIKHHIEQGKYPIGSTLPTEVTLCEQFNVSRHTVREALRELRRIGLIASKQGSGSVVLAKSSNTQYIHAVNTIHDLMGIHHDTQRKILASTIEPVERSLADKLHINPKQLWVRIELIHNLLKTSAPIIHSVAYIDAKYSEMQKRYNPKQLLIEQLQELYSVNIDKMRQEIQAVAFNKKESEIFKCKVGAPALKTTRCYYGSDHALICMSINLAPGDQYIYTSDFQLNDAPF